MGTTYYEHPNNFLNEPVKVLDMLIQLRDIAFYRFKSRFPEKIENVVIL